MSVNIRHMVAPQSPPSIRIRSAVYRSDVGKVRKTNEDGVLSLSKIPLYAVADGTGGPEAARTSLMLLKDNAAQLAARNSDVAASPSSTSRLAVGRLLDVLFSKANTAVYEQAEQIKDRRIATSLCAMTIVNTHAFFAHVGDSRAYLLRNGKFRCLTEDHTLAALQLRRGDISPEDFETSPFRHTLAQAIGMSPAVDVDVLELRLSPGDTLLLTTNGLMRSLSDEVIHACLESDGDADLRADLLLKKVKDAGAPDNTTFIIVQTEPSDRPRSRAEDHEKTARKSYLFSSLSDTEWFQVLPYLEVVETNANEVLSKSGEAPLGFGVVASGKVRSLQAGGEVRDVGPAEHFGALYLATDSPGQETVTALEKSTVYVLTRQRFSEIIRLAPTLGSRLTFALLEALGNRLGVLTTRIGQVLDAANGKL
jgi:protein phosphatase